MAQARVKQRVSEGGHKVPNAVVARRHVTGLRNLCGLYLPLADSALIYDNATSAGMLIAERKDAGRLIVYDATKWKAIEGA